MSREETTPTSAMVRKRRLAGLIAISAVLMLPVAWYLVYGRCGGEHPQALIGTWKLASAEGKLRDLRYRFFEDGQMWTYVGLERSISTWHVADGELLIISHEGHRTAGSSLGQLVEFAARTVRDPCDLKRSIKFAIEKVDGHLLLTPTEDYGFKVQDPKQVVFERVVEQDH